MKLFSDDPIRSSEEDQLQRSAFAEQVAQVCGRVHEQGESSVIALIGPWGSGKTSILNMIQAVLAAGGTWLVGEYNPWLLSDTETLIREFFVELRELLPAEHQKGKLRDTVRQYANAVSPVVSALGLVGVNVPEQVKALAEDLLRGDTSLSKRRHELEEALRAAGRPILLILDDLDRLEPAELMMVFKLVRLVGRLPNVYYLLSYDENTLLDVIMQTDLARGNRDRAHNYLEKIVQLRLDLPPLHRRQQLKLVNAALDEVANKYHVAMSDADQRLLSEAYERVLKYNLDEPRAINRYFAQIDALYPLVGGEVNFVDFALITFVRTEYPAIYNLVRTRRDELVNKVSFELALRDKEPLADQKARWVRYLEDTKCAEPGRLLTLLSLLFLPIKSAVQGSNYGGTFYDDLRLGKRIGSQDYFDRYFQLGLPEGDLSDQAIARQLQLLADTDEARAHEAAEWLRLALLADPVLFVAKVRNDADLPNGSASQLLEVLGSGYTSLPVQPGMLGLDPKWQVIRLSRRLFAALPEETRELVTASLLQSVGGLSLLADLVETSLTDRDSDEPEVIEANRKIRGIAEQVTDALKQHFAELAEKPLAEAEPNDVILLYRLQKLVGDGMRDIVWHFVDQGHWPLTDFVAWVTPTVTIWGDGATRSGIGELRTADLDQLFGLDRLLEGLHDVLDEPAQEVSNKAEPTLDNRRAYALNVLREIRSSRQAAKDKDTQAS